MITITKERLLTIKQWRETYGPGSNVVLPAEEAEELARIALASLEAEPVAWTDEEELRDVRKYGFGEIFQCPPDKYADPRRVISLYRELPAPVVPDDWQLVPKKITLEMECALSKADSYEIGWLWALAAAPKYEVQNAKRVQNALNACRAAMLQSGNFRENKNSSTNNFREIAETSTNYPAIPSEVLSAILKVARIRADFDDFDGDRRGIGDCLDEAEQELIVTINKYASQLAAEPIATNDVREQQTAVPPVPEIQDDVAQAIENLKQKLVECNRYNYCADAVKGVEDACHAAMLQGRERLVLDAATRTAAGGEMMDVKEKVLQVMRSRAALQDKALGGEYPFRMATWNLRLAMEKEFPDEEWRSADLRKILMELAKDGTVSKDTHASRIGQAVWRLEVR
ncbi:Phage protein [Escherichia coli O10:K5(L):H4 str. ATCC 23506]|uniref:DUF551 domain-containing protein n=11 Tax=root TaxID=1 RepID=A0AAV1IQ76_ECOLX|nr:hypothetical protein FGAF1140_50150 [Escherichia coli]CAK1259083.1 hypothetical protein FGAS159_46420 [Escherichia coli]CCP95104.1 Phage protein [Escherichia coli O10:K5(L):H4 str. ATCC 23506]CDL28036.1 Phage protein [Escherichia coli ISC7]STK05165.1 Valyl-tRNA synthetase [Escherichia coli]